MKILKLRLKNLNSLKGEWAIDFTRPPFTENSLFAEIKTFRKGQPQGDDMTVVLLRYIGEGRE